MLRKAMIAAMMILVVMTLAAQNSPEEKGNAFANEGDQLFNSGKYQEAGEKYMAAKAQYELAKKDGAIVDDKIAKMVKNGSAAFGKAKDWPKVLELWRIQLAENPNNAKLVNKIALLQSKYMKDYDGAIATWTEFEARNSGYTPQKKIANLYLDKAESGSSSEQRQNWRKALQWFQKANASKPGDADIIKNIATLHLWLDEPANAVAAFEDFLKQNPGKEDRYTVYVAMGLMYEENLGNLSKAIANYEKALNTNFSKDIALKLMTLYFTQENYAKSSEMARRVLQNDSDNNHALFTIAEVKYKQKDLAGARSGFEKLVNDREYGDNARKYLETIESEM